MPEQIVKAPMKGRVIRFHREKGGAVKEKEKVCDIEALKMEIPIVSPAGGTIKEIFATAGQNVQAGDPLFSIES
jgi:biotin carboxyl carrier protein